jgi:hypothetical protein
MYYNEGLFGHGEQAIMSCGQNCIRFVNVSHFFRCLSNPDMAVRAF